MLSKERGIEDLDKTVKDELDQLEYELEKIKEIQKFFDGVLHDDKLSPAFIAKLELPINDKFFRYIENRNKKIAKLIKQADSLKNKWAKEN
jgi:hypothetical protein